MNENLATILIVEDEQAIRRFVRSALEAEGFRVCEADGVQRGLIEAATRKPDLVVLDLGLPDGDGQDFIRDLRLWSPIPVIVLSARVDETDKVKALDAGADDYLIKPFGIGELLARIRVALRRRGQVTDSPSPLVQLGDVSIDLVSRRITRGDEEIHLTPIEFRLLGELLAHPDKVMTHRQLLLAVWGPTFVEHNHYLRIYMGHLRQKLEVDPTLPRYLLTETGIGYRYQAEPDAGQIGSFE